MLESFIRKISPFEKDNQVMIMSKKYYDEQVQYMNEIRSIKHDMQAHMIALQHYIEKDQLDKAKEYLKEMRSYQIFQSTPIRDTGNDMVNAVIYSALERGESEVRLSSTGYIPENTTIADYDLCTIFSNLFSNSVEACKKLKVQDKVITLDITEAGGYLTISIENPVEWKVNKKILGRSTTKADKAEHGFGIRNVKAAIKKYNGDMVYEVTDRLFRVKVTLPDIVIS